MGRAQRAEASFEKVFLPFPEGATGDPFHDLASGPVPEDDPKPEWLPQITWDALGRNESGRNLRQFVKSSAAIVAAVLGRSRKCLVVDLDGTLWGGVIGDDGVGGIALGEGDALGEAFKTFQAHLKDLRERGVLLAV